MTSGALSKLLTYLMINLMVSFFEIGLFFLAYQGAISFSVVVAGHLLISVGLLLSILMLWRSGRQASFFVIIAILVIFSGPFGCLAGLMAIATEILLIMVKTTTLDDLLKTIFPENRSSNISELFQRVKYGMEEYDSQHLPLSYNDIMAFGTSRQKRIAIERILKYFRPEFAESLMLGLNDSANSIRVLSATAVSRINDKYADGHAELEKRLKQEPNNKRLIMEAGQYCESYSTLAFIDSRRSRVLSERAVELFEHYDRLSVDDPEALLSLGRLQYTLGHYQEAKNYLERLFIKENRVDDEGYKWYLNTLFQLKDYDALRRFVQRDNLIVSGQGVDHDDIVDQIVLWRRGIPEKMLSTEEAYGG
ncbi:MAG: tetratricopeptide repeat protein [Chlamydiales bacterium]|nr:tetratricopeptide repeat protein [Chlamydiia bacterium]MCP5508373.1 tetratricopeptide repeat protein [Chlamydiales bacterium]